MQAAIALDPDSPTPAYRQIYEAWRESILGGRFPPGARIPSTRALAVALGIARSTVTQAYEQLIAEGYLHAAHGSGTFVCRELPGDLQRSSAPERALAVPPIPLSPFGKRLNQEIGKPMVPRGAIQLSRLSPDLDRFPFAIWRRLVKRHVQRGGRALFDYAAEPAGHRPLREQIAAYVSRARAVHCTPEQIVVVSGSQQALDLCARLLLAAGHAAAVENPGYAGARQAFASCGARLLSVPVDAEGIDVSELPSDVRVVHVTPSHQFPTGAAMSLSRRLALIDWARRCRAVIIEDDYDSEYRYSGSPLPALQGLADDVAVIYCGTFSKVMFPALRIGYAVVPIGFAPVLAHAKSLADRHSPMLEQAALADFIGEGHLERHIRRMRKLYGRRRQVLVESLAHRFGRRVEILGDPAGMHVLVRIDDDGIEARAAADGIHCARASACYLGPAPENEFLFGFSSISEGVIREAVCRL